MFTSKEILFPLTCGMILLFIDFISYIMSFFDSLSKSFYHTTIPFFRLSILLLPIPVHLKKPINFFVFPLITAAPANFVSPFIEITFCKRKLDPDRIFPSNLASDTGGKILVVLFLLSAIPDKRNAGISPFFCLIPVPPSLAPC